MRTAKLGFLFTLFISQFSILDPLHAAFLDPYWSSRVAALSGAFTALSNDASAVFYNSAAAVYNRRREADFTYARLFAGLEGENIALNNFAYHQPVGRYTAYGIGWGSFTSEIYQELSLAVSYARDLKPFLRSYEGELSVGLAVRYLSRKFDLDVRSSADPVFKDGSRVNAAALDLNLYSVPDPLHLPGLSLGLSLKSVNQPDIGFRDRERLPTEVHGGILWRKGRFNFPIDISARKGEITPHAGIEASLWNNQFRLRGGYDKSQMGTGFGYEHSLSPSFTMDIDYSFLWPLELKETSGSHRATLGVKF